MPEKIKIGEIEWKPKTRLGLRVAREEIVEIEEIFKQGKRIEEPEIVDKLLPNLDNELILIGGTPGKGGGIRRTPSKRTVRMHKSGRRLKNTILSVVGNRNGFIGVGTGIGDEFRTTIEKSIKKAKLNIIPIKRGCGSWECECGEPHSIPCSVEGKSGSVRVNFKPAPKGVGLVVSDEMKKLLKLGGIEDIWIKTFGSTRTRENLIRAGFNAFKELNKVKMDKEYEDKSGVVVGRI